MTEWEYWTVTIGESPQREEIFKQALAEGGRLGYELASCTPIVASRWDMDPINTGVMVGTAGYILIFKRPKASPTG